MNFDQMMETWRAQDEAPLYGVNRDLLQMVLQHEQANIRRTLRRDQWIAYIGGAGMAAFAGFWLWVAIVRGERLLKTAAAVVCTGAFVVWVGAFWLSRRRQARRERSFGNTLQEEVRRNLSLVEYQLSTGGRWGSALLWSAPPVIGAVLIYWLMAEINDNTNSWYDAAMMVLVLGWTVWSTYAGSRAAERKLEPRRQRLSELLQTLNASE
jgi:uncharacterized membrane protein YfcA